MSIDPAEAGAAQSAMVADLVAALIAGAAGVGAGAPVERVRTHLSEILLCGDRVWKLTRAVRLPFVDTTDLAARRRIAREEVAANFAAGSLYARAAAVRRKGERIWIGPDPAEMVSDEDPEVVDWVVEMRRFDRALEFGRLLAAGRLGVAEIEGLADVVAVMHRTAPARRVPNAAARLFGVFEKVAGSVRGADAPEEIQAPAAEWAASWDAAWRRARPRLDARGRHGFVRRCHGDLHLGNICLFEEDPTPFDAIAFDEEIATIDVGYDIAFTVMDLARRDAPDLAVAYVSRYLSATRDHHGLPLAPLFASLRAGVRAMVARFSDAPTEAAELLRFATRLLSDPPRPRVIAVGGASGAGKTVLARRLAGRIGGASAGRAVVLLRSDVIRKRLLGVDPETPLPPRMYGPEISDRVYARLARDARRALNAGASVILDAAHLTQARRAETADIAERSGAPFTGLFLDASPELRAARVITRTGDASDADATVATAQRIARVDAAEEARGWRVVSAATTPDAVFDAAMKILEGSDTTS